MKNCAIPWKWDCILFKHSQKLRKFIHKMNFLIFFLWVCLFLRKKFISKWIMCRMAKMVSAFMCPFLTPCMDGWKCHDRNYYFINGHFFSPTLWHLLFRWIQIEKACFVLFNKTFNSSIEFQYLCLDECCAHACPSSLRKMIPHCSAIAEKGTSFTRKPLNWKILKCWINDCKAP